MEQVTNQNWSPVKSFLILIILGILGLTVLNAYFSARKVAADQIRVGDIQLIQQFLKAYNDNQGNYPTSSQNQPQGWQSYLEFLPQPPANADGCSIDSNQYKYSSQNSGKSYRLSFCLGRSVGPFIKGNNSLGPD